MQTSVTHVLVHGFAGAAESWRAVPLASPSLALTMPGHGPEPVRSSGFAGYVDWLCEAVSGLGPVHLVGYSAGGRVVLGALQRGVECVAASLISTGFASAAADERSVRAETDAAWSSLLRTQGMEAFVAAWETQPLFASQRRADPALLEAQRAVRRGLSSDAGGRDGCSERRAHARPVRDSGELCSPPAARGRRLG